MSFYSNLAAIASRLLDTYGQTASFSRVTGGTKNAATGITSGTSTTTYSGKGAAFDYNRSEIDGTLIVSGDIRLMLEATTTAPLVGDTCTVSSIAYRVESVKESSPGGEATHYELQLRK
jgi:hypothetical protein